MIRTLISIYIYIIIIDALLSYFPQVQRQAWAKGLRQVADFSQKPIRPYMPKDWPFDPSPIVVIIVLNIIMALW